MYLKDVLLFVSLITMANPYSLPLLISTTDLSGITSTPVRQRKRVLRKGDLTIHTFVAATPQGSVVDYLTPRTCSDSAPRCPVTRQEDCPRMHFGVCGHA